MDTILIVREAKSHLLTAIHDGLKNMSYQVIEVHADTDAIHEVKETIGGILVYADEVLAKQIQSLNFLKDKAVMDDIPIFAVGESENVKAVKTVIPKDLIRLEFLRPLNVNSLVDTVHSFVQQFRLQVKKKILAVDDSGAMLRNVKGWLEDKYHVSLVNSGAMAIKYLALNRPDLVLLDYDMPVVDGKQVLEMIRTETDFADIPVIFLTNKGDKESFMQVKELKPEGYLLKTMEPAQIIKAIDDFFDMRKGLI